MKTLLAAVAVMALVPASAQAQDATQAETTTGAFEQRAADVVAVMREEMAYDAVFNEAFRNQVPEAQFSQIAVQLEGQFGLLIGVENVEATSDTAGTLQIRFERGLATANMSIEPEEPYLVNGLLLTGVEPINDSAEAVIEDLAALPGDTSMLVMRLGADVPLIAHNADMPLALGSTFKLYVLSALAQAVAAGDLRWDDTVALSAQSFPSGVMQDWPEGAPVTLHTLATLMISISDNTATDQLIAVLGREAIEAEIAASGHSDPALMRPMLTTRELFLLKSQPDFDGDAFLALSEDERRSALAALTDAERTDAQIMAAFGGGPNNINVEWFASGEDIAALFTRMASLDDHTAMEIMGVSPGVAENVAANWDYIGYKGGSEPGVLNMSWLMRNDVGEWYVATIGWNNPEVEVDLSTVSLLSTRAIALAN